MMIVLQIGIEPVGVGEGDFIAIQWWNPRCASLPETPIEGNVTSGIFYSGSCHHLFDENDLLVIPDDH